MRTPTDSKSKSPPMCEWWPIDMKTAVACEVVVKYVHKCNAELTDFCSGSLPVATAFVFLHRQSTKGPLRIPYGNEMFRLNSRNTMIGFATKSTNKNTSSISALQAAFRDPSSPFYLAPGEQGPAESPDSTLVASREDSSTDTNRDSGSRQAAQEILRKRGFDPGSFWEQTITWGDHDAFQHVNNARYFRFFESARIKWMMALGEQLGGPSRARAMLNGEGISLILKSIEINFRRPVTFPDNLLIGYKVLPFEDERELSTFNVAASAYSLSQKAFVAHAKETIVWYDYDQLKKCVPEDKAIEILKKKSTASGSLNC